MRPFPHVDGVEHRFVEVGPLRLHVAEAGSGDPLVLVHGWPQHWFAWRRLIPELAGRYRVICLDLRGFGWSDAPPGRYEKKTLGGDIIGVLDALDLDRVRLVGHDWGALAGFFACLRAPERFERFAPLSVVSPWFRPMPSLATLAGIAYQSVLIAPYLGRRLVSTPAFIRRLIVAGSGRPDVWTPEVLDSYAQQFTEPDRARATVALYRAFQFLEVWPMAFGKYAHLRLTTPTFAMYGEHDTVVKGGAYARVDRHADSFRVEKLAGAGHFLPEEVPETVLEHLLPFLAPSA